MKRHSIAAGIFLALGPATAGAQDMSGPGNIRAGRELAIAQCSECHVVVPRRGTSWQTGRPPDFTQIANMPGMTRTALLAFQHSPHPKMPNLILSDRKTDDLIAYILSLKNPGVR
ncbi:c-type cytochrome [Sphingomonas sp. MMS24-J13]|uniref:c-type cytochrome n=1 Tax=Sphingomonas sp. MMS24-J13 TaxID=3238686 RepID=UPI00384C1ADE